MRRRSSLSNERSQLPLRVMCSGDARRILILDLPMRTYSLTQINRHSGLERHLKACGHVRHVGVCPTCQRAQLERWRIQLVQAQTVHQRGA